MRKRNKIIDRIVAFSLLSIAIFSIYTEIESIKYKREMGFYNYYIPMTYPILSSKELCENCTLKIPKIIHRVWMVFDPTRPNMPELYKKYDRRLKELHPDWKIMEWNDETSLEFVKKHYPDFLPTYYSYTRPVQRLDAVRYLLVHYYGGLAIQHSFYVEKNLEPLLKGHEFIVSDFLSLEKQYSLFISNNFFASVPKHPILSKTISYLKVRSAIAKKNYSNTEYVLLTTGPLLFSDAIYNYLYKNHDKNVKILDESFITPFNNIEKLHEPIWSKCIVSPQDCHQLYNEAYAFTIWAGSWKN